MAPPCSVPPCESVGHVCCGTAAAGCHRYEFTPVWIPRRRPPAGNFLTSFNTAVHARVSVQNKVCNHYGVAANTYQVHTKCYCCYYIVVGQSGIICNIYDPRYGSIVKYRHTASARPLLTRPARADHARPGVTSTYIMFPSPPRISAIVRRWFCGAVVLPFRLGMSSPLSWSVSMRRSSRKEGRGSRSASPSIVLTTCCTLLRTG